jgi:signal transduction histidine kinase
MSQPKVEDAGRSPVPTGAAPTSGVGEQASRINDGLLALIAHELRDPLNAIRSAVQMLRQGGDPDLREWGLGVMDRQTAQMSSLIEELLELSRVRQGKVQPRKQSLDLAEVVALAIETMRPGIEERGHVLEVSLPPEPLPIEADPTLLEHVLTNLLGNAAKYMEPGGRIWLTAEHKEKEIVVRVRDTGVGIVPEALPEVFQLFWQSPQLAHSRTGLGIGLALVQQFVEMHGGKVSAHSDGPGKGSEFVVRLPAPPRTGLDEASLHRQKILF